MAIQIRAHLTATPNPTTLPRRIDFHQTLRSNLTSETIAVEFFLDPDHDIWFQDANGKPTKTVQRGLTVTPVDQAFLIRICLQRGPGAGSMTMVEIDQTITDSSGIKIPDSAVLRIG
jgi:hypothetical protein